MAYKIIPLTSDPDQSFACTIPVNGENLKLGFRVKYNTVGDYWALSIYDKSKKCLINSLPLVYSEYPAANLLDAYDYLKIGSACLVKVGNSTTDRPDDTNLGTDFLLVWGDN